MAPSRCARLQAANHARHEVERRFSSLRGEWKKHVSPGAIALRWGVKRSGGALTNTGRAPCALSGPVPILRSFVLETQDLRGEASVDELAFAAGCRAAERQRVLRATADIGLPT